MNPKARIVAYYGGQMRLKLNRDEVVRILFWALAIYLGFSQAWSSRMNLVNDTVSFLDLGDFMFSGQWKMAVNGYWNPLYAFLLGLVNFTFKPSPYWEYPLVHLLLLFVFILALWCFDFFLQEMLLVRCQSEQADELHVPVWAWMTIGYTIFLWSSLALITVSETNPDMLVALFFYLACGLMLRLRRGGTGWGGFVAFGVVLGLGYLTKTIFFPISVVCLAVVWLMNPRSRRHLRGAATAAAVFVFLAGPYIAALSLQKHKLTFGENATINYLVDIDHVPLSHWQGGDPHLGELVHPVHQVLIRPATFEFARPAGTTYPVWDDPSYFYEGAKPEFRLREMLRVLKANLGRETWLLLSAFDGGLVASLFILFGVNTRGKNIARDIAGYWFLLAPVIVTFGLYMILHIDNRYVGPFYVVGLLCLFFSVHLRESMEGQKLFTAVALLLLTMFFLPVGPGAWIPKDIATPVRELLSEPLGAAQNPNADVVQGLQLVGLQPGDPIASVELSSCAIWLDNLCQAVSIWARLGRYRVVGEVYYTPMYPNTLLNHYWTADPIQQLAVLRALARSGARIVVSWEEPKGPGAADWQQIHNTHWYFHWLETAAVGAAQDSSTESVNRLAR